MEIEKLKLELEIFKNKMIEEKASLKLELKTSKDKIDKLIKENTSLKLNNKKLKDSLIDLQEKYLDKNGEYAKEYAKRYVSQLENSYKEIQEYMKLVIDEKTLYKSIKSIIKENHQEIINDFMAGSFELIVKKYQQAFIDRLNSYIKENKLDETLEKYIIKRVNNSLSKYKGENVKEIIQMITKDITEKYSYMLSKEIIKEMSDMQVVHLDTIEYCNKKLNQKRVELTNRKIEIGGLLE